ncbi:MAG: dihydrodipicolinate reductase [Bryobacteraceae bacterium]|nr:dihydrodipicolinate reductase [Bryobacteraceae bacterium]
MKLAIVGYGRMGRMVEALAPAYGFEVIARIDEGGDLGQAAPADAAIEFTTPEAALTNIEALAALRVPIVCGTTGWFQRLEAARSAVERTGGALVYSPNFSVGVHVFARLTELAASLLKDESEYEAWAWEIHHSKKKDAPSGTLLKLLEVMRAGGYARAIDSSSSRAGAHPGTHEIGFDSASDTITLRHAARSREGFARGALRAAQWIRGKTGVYEFSEVLFGAEGGK